MDILRQQSQWDDILARCKDEDFETAWPDALIFDATLCRARAYAVKRDAPHAERDFLLAARSTLSANHKSSAYQGLGDLYRDVCNDPQRAIETYGKVLTLQVTFRRLAEAATARARLLASCGKGEQAIAELDQLMAGKAKGLSQKPGRRPSEPMASDSSGIGSKDPQSCCAIQICCGDVYDRMGKKAEALAKYRAAAACQGAPESLLATARKKIEAIERN